jgi:hypothetical protein
MKRKTVIIIIVIVVVILMAVSSWLIYRRYFKKEKTNIVDEPIIPDYSSGIGSGGYAQTSFPIKKGMNGAEVTDIQNAINKKCNKGLVADGAFGPLTEAALKSCYNTTTVSQTLYTQMKFDSGSTQATNVWPKVGDKVYLKGGSGNLYSYPSFSANYLVGSVEKNYFLDKPIGVYVSSTTGGFVKITVFGYKPHGSSTYIAKTLQVFIPNTSIQKTPY